MKKARDASVAFFILRTSSLDSQSQPGDAWHAGDAATAGEAAAGEAVVLLLAGGGVAAVVVGPAGAGGAGGLRGDVGAARGGGLPVGIGREHQARGGAEGQRPLVIPLAGADGPGLRGD